MAEERCKIMKENVEEGKRNKQVMSDAWLDDDKNYVKKEEKTMGHG